MFPRGFFLNRTCVHLLTIKLTWPFVFGFFSFFLSCVIVLAVLYASQLKIVLISNRHINCAVFRLSVKFRAVSMYPAVIYRRTYVNKILWNPFAYKFYFLFLRRLRRRYRNISRPYLPNGQYSKNVFSYYKIYKNFSFFFIKFQVRKDCLENSYRKIPQGKHSKYCRIIKLNAFAHNIIFS